MSKAKPKLKRPASMPIQFQAKQSNALYAAADKAVGRHNPPDVRDDIITDIVILVLDGEFGMDDITGAARKATSAYWKGREGFRQRSMDAPLSSGDTRTLQDVLGG